MNIPICLAALVLGGVARAQDVEALRIQEKDVAGLGKVTVDEPLSVALRAPAHWLARAVGEARALLPDEVEGPIDAALGEAAEDAGFAAIDPASWREVGLDPDGDVAFAVGDLGGFLNLPQRIRMFLPALDAERLGRFLVEQNGIDEVEPTADGGLVGPGFAFQPIGKTLIVVAHGGNRDAAAMAAELGSAVETFGGGQTVAGTTVYRSLAARLGEGAWGAMFLRPSRWRAADAPPPESEPLVESFVAAFGPRSVVAALHLEPSADRTKLLARGGDPRGALAAMPEPAAVLTVSLADIDALLASLAADDDEVAAIRRDQVELVGMLGPLLKGGSLGILAYPAPRSGEPVWAAFATTRDHEAAVAAIEAALAAVPVEVRPLEAPAGARLWHSPSEGVVLGVRGGVVYAGNAVQHVSATVRGEAEGHEPAVAGDAIVELHVSLHDLLGPLGAIAPRALSEGGLAGRIDVDGDVLVGTIRRTGADAATSWLGEAIAWAAIANSALGAAEDSRLDKARSDLAAIHGAATMYAVRNAKVPTIEDLLEPDSTGNPYIEGGEPPLDPWGNVYVFRRLEGRLRFAAVSFGPDGLEDTEDDLVHPARPPQRR